MYKQKLIDLLKYDEQVKQSMEKLDLGCRVKTDIKNYKNTVVLFHGFQTTDYTGRMFEYILCINGNKIKKISKWKVIGLPLQERFIRMYCKNNRIKFDIKQFVGEDEVFINTDIVVKIDNLKDFDNQDNEVYKKIYETLLKIN